MRREALNAYATGTERRALAVLATAALLPFALLAVWAAVASPAPWEPGVLSALALGTGPAAELIGLVNLLGNLPVWIPLALLLAVVVGFVRGARAALLIGLSLLSDAAAFVVKVLVERQRPDSAATEHFFGADNFAFPSGHVVRAVALVAVLAWILVPPPWRLRLALSGGLLAGLVMGYARVALGVHWPTDALGGTLLGLAWFAFTAWLIR